MATPAWEDIESFWYRDFAYHHDGDDPDYDDYDIPAEMMMQDGKWGMLDARTAQDGKGEIIFPPQWDDGDQLGSGYSPDGKPDGAVYFFLVCKDGKKGVVDTAGRVVSSCHWDEIDAYGNARLGKQWGFIHLLTCQITPPQWPENQHLHPYEEGFVAEDIDSYGAWFRGKHSWIKTMIIFKMDKKNTSNG